MQAGQRLISQHVQVVALGLVGQQHSIVLHRKRLLSKRSCRVLQLCLQLKYVFADLWEDRALQRCLTLAGTLAVRCLHAGFIERMQHELDVLHRSTNCIVDHFEGGLVSTRLLALAGVLATVGTTTYSAVWNQSLLLLGRVHLFLQVVTLQKTNVKVRWWWCFIWSNHISAINTRCRSCFQCYYLHSTSRIDWNNWWGCPWTSLTHRSNVASFT